MNKLTTAAGIVLAGVMTVSLAACGLFDGVRTDGNFPSDVALLSGEYEDAVRWLAAQETPSTSGRRRYAEAAEGGYAGTYYDFLAQEGIRDDTAYISRAQCSTVAVQTRTASGNGVAYSDGSGIIYALDRAAGEALIVTNAHVVSDAVVGTSFAGGASVTVTLSGGETLSSAAGDDIRLCGMQNTTSDVAVLSVRSDALQTGCAMAAAWAEASENETAYAVGNAEGMGMSVTGGTVTDLSRTVTVEGADGDIALDVLCTDAAVNHGNSGGGLYNAAGELLGLVTARQTLRGNTASDGVGYAIPAADVNAVLASLDCGQIAAAEGKAVPAQTEAALSEAEKSAVSVVAKTRKGASEGSGVIIANDESAGEAYILTNYHVVYTGETASGISDEIDVYFHADQKEEHPVKAQFVGGAMAEDIAVLRVAWRADRWAGLYVSFGAAEAAQAADSRSLTVGERTIVVGNANGDGLRTTQGVLCVASETIAVASADEKTALSLFAVRTDAVIEHGNSGGGLYNEMGELIGIVCARSEKEGVLAFGYAIPANRALRIAQNILDNASVTDGALCARLGITVESYASRAFYDGVTGKMYPEEKVIVRGVSAGSAALRMGLDVGDTLYLARIEREGEIAASCAITRTDVLSELLYGVRRGDTLTLTVSRRGQVKEVSYTFSSDADFAEVT